MESKKNDSIVGSCEALVRFKRLVVLYGLVVLDGAAGGLFRVYESLQEGQWWK